MTYTFGIRKVLLDNIADAQRSIIIAMAWFTDNQLKDGLIACRKEKPSVRIEIVVDPNHINKKYFSDYAEKFKNAGIIIRNKEVRNFLHHKFMLIDGKICITGSYNYSRKAEMNLESITVLKSKKACRVLEKEFMAITDKNYEDQNVKILEENPEFARKLLSTFYKFSKSEYNRYKKKIVIGECYTYPTGFYDRIHFSPGIIFNTEIEFDITVREKEFKIPLSKHDLIKILTAHNQANIIDSYSGHEEFYNEINKALKRNEKFVLKSFEKTVKNAFSAKKIKKLIDADIDIIIEDYFWISNFGPYLNKKHVQRLFDSLSDVKQFNTFEDYL